MDMSDGVSSSSGSEIFLVKCAGYKCLAVRGANGGWKSFYDDAELPHVAEPIAAIPFELILPFLDGAGQEQSSPVPLPAREQIQLS
jgi:hypothetical protein